MGDRANIYVHNGDRPGVYLYAHWAGSELPQVVYNALARKQRWDDDQYLTRILFCEMVKDDIDGATGYGISAYCGDGGDRIIDVDTATQIVGLRTEETSDDSERVTFAEFVLTDAPAELTC